MEAVGEFFSPNNSLFCRSPLTKILNLTCQDFHQIVFLLCKNPCMDSQAHPPLALELKKPDC